jgi:hypothetical protein
MHVPLNIRGEVYDQYQCHDNGQIFSLHSNKFLSHCLQSQNKYLRTCVTHQGKPIYAAIATIMGWSWEECGIQKSPLVHWHDLKLGSTEYHVSIDHINLDRFDNRLSNLRICTSAEQNMNHSSHKGSSSRFRGVSRPPSKSHRDKKYVAKCSLKGLKRWSKTFYTEEEAAAAYNCQARIMLKEKYGEELGQQLIDEVFNFNVV